MRIFVTGGTGFIGSHFLNHAFKAGHEVVALRHSPASQPRIPLDAQPEWVNGPMDQLKLGDFRNCEFLVHLAAHSANVPYDTLEKRALFFQSSCNREKIERVLISLGREELANMIEKQGDAEARCEFCTEIYPFSREDIKRLLEHM